MTADRSSRMYTLIRALFPASPRTLRVIAVVCACFNAVMGIFLIAIGERGGGIGMLVITACSFGVLWLAGRVSHEERRS